MKEWNWFMNFKIILFLIMYVLCELLKKYRIMERIYRHLIQITCNSTIQ